MFIVFHVFVDQVVSDKHKDVMVFMQSRTSHTFMLGMVGMLVFNPYWYWFPLSHFISMTVQEQVCLGQYIAYILLKICILQIVETQEDGVDGEEGRVFHTVLVGGGEHGGSRRNAGRKSEKSASLKKVDWKIYKKIGKKEENKLKKGNKSIHEFFPKVKANSEQIIKEQINNERDSLNQGADGNNNKDDKKSTLINEDTGDMGKGNMDCDSLNNVIGLYQEIFGDKRISFFQNGCFASKSEKFSKSGNNYSCAVDSFLTLCEAILLCGNVQSISHTISFSPLLQEARKVLIWRLENNYEWNQNLRNPLWQLLATSFPQAFCPIGKVTAAVEPAVLELEKLWYIEVIVDAECSACSELQGTFRLVCEELILSSPKNGEMKNSSYTLPELLMNRISKHVNYVLRHKVRCFNSSCGGLPVHTGIRQENLKFPPFLFLNFLVSGTPSNYFNDFKDSCILEESLKLNNHTYSLLCGLMSSQLHFFSICNLFGNFYKLDNMIQEPTTKGFSSFTEAYNGKVSAQSESQLFHLSKKTVKSRKGAVYFAVYQGDDRNENVEIEWAGRLESYRTLNDLPNLLTPQVDESPINS